jgi:trk system potassium uptake protein
VHVVVIGCGRVGSGLAITLESEGHTVAIIDRQARAFRRLPADFKGQKLVGIGFDRERLKEAGIERAGALAAVTNGDNSNIVVARVAREAFGVERVVARIYDSRRAAIYERLGIPTVKTVEWATQQVLHKILPDAQDVKWVDPSAKVCMIERIVPTSWAGRRLLDLEAPGIARVAALSRLGEAQLPDPKLVVQEGDIVWLTVAGDQMDAFAEHLSGKPETGGHH